MFCPLTPHALTYSLRPSPPGNAACLSSSRALTSPGSWQQELVKKPKPTAFVLFSTPALKISSCHQQADNKASLHITSGDSPVPPRAGRASAGIQLARVEVSSRDHLVLVQWYFYCNMFAYPLASRPPAVGLARSRIANSAKGSKLCTSSKIHHPSPPSRVTHGNQSVPSAPAPEHPPTRRPGASRPVPAHSTRRSVAMVRWRKADLKSRFQPCSCGSGAASGQPPFAQTC